MMKLCLTASHGYPPGLLFSPEQPGVGKVLKPISPGPGLRHDIFRSDSHTHSLKAQQPDLNKKFDNVFPGSSHFVKTDSLFSMPASLDSKEKIQGSIQFSLRIAEQCKRHEKVLKLLSSAANGMEKDGLDLSLLSDLMEFQVTVTNMYLNQANSARVKSDNNWEMKPSFSYPNGIINAEEKLVQFVDKFLPNSSISVDSNGKTLFTSNITEMGDLPSVLEEFYLARWSKPTFLVPQFNWANAVETQLHVSLAPLELQTLRIAPLKSPEKVKPKQASKRKGNKKATKERNLYEKNYSHACETFLSLMMDRNRSGKTVIHSLKKSGAELPHLLNQFSASIAGTGLAILFSVFCNVVCGRASLYSASKVLTTSIGISMVWLSWAVNKLRQTVVEIRKSPTKLGFKEEDQMLQRVDKGVNDIFFRAATVTAIAMLSVA